jgi:hypothetical protein
VKHSGCPAADSAPVVSARAAASFPQPTGTRPLRFLVGVLAGLLAVSPLSSDVASAKRKAAPVEPPDLRIVSVVVSPEPFVPASEVLDLRVEVELPVEVNPNTLLEVSSLITSPSMRSMRFLSVRRPVQIPPRTASTSEQPPPKMNVILSWDGRDQSNEMVAGGRYHYEIRAKLLAVGENGARTQMNSWPKRGTLVVKSP